MIIISQTGILVIPSKEFIDKILNQYMVFVVTILKNI
jgi:hypothetical protein